jgi:hypothetical protein
VKRYGSCGNFAKGFMSLSIIDGAYWRIHMTELIEELQRKLNLLCKWRSVFASWQLGIRSDTDAECAALKDHREVTILLRTEVSALAGCLIRAGVISQEDFQKQLIEEA